MDDGYYSSVTYPVEFHRQYTPVWLTLASVLCGYRPRPLDRPFRWCDIGCGQGFTALGVASLYPHAEVFGFDYNPSHIENASRLAAEAGLSNVIFSDSSFEDLATAAPNTWPKMDFIVLHGVWSWISPVQRRHVLSFITRHLAPGGIVYNGYNALAGWAAMQPLQKLLRHVCTTQSGDTSQIIAAGNALLQQLMQHNAAFFSDNPIAARRLEFLGRQDQNYFAHELLHEHWTPFSPDEVAADFTAAQCSFIGSATLLENFDIFSVPQALVPILVAEQNPARKEILRDLGAARMFRRDIFRRGNEKPLPGEYMAALDDITLTDLGLPDDGTMKIKSWGDEGLVLRPEIYNPIRQGLRAGPLRLGDLREIFPDVATLKEITAVLTATGVAHPTPFLTPSAAQLASANRFNQMVARHNAAGGKAHLLAAPRLGTALTVEDSEQALAAAFAGADPANLLEDAAMRLAATGRELLQSGQPVLEPEARLAGWRRLAAHFAATRLPVLQRTGAVP
jgi:predicted O-methyltransferase YrrM